MTTAAPVDPTKTAAADITSVFKGAQDKFSAAVGDATTVTKEYAAKVRQAAGELYAELANVEGMSGKADALIMKNPKVAIGAAIIGGAVAAKLLSGGSKEQSV